jgi:hypothetical protein
MVIERDMVLINLEEGILRVLRLSIITWNLGF